ncbi:MAG: hypothetical protein ACLTQI_09115 [Slackia sp.]
MNGWLSEGPLILLKYQDSPVPAELIEALSDDLTSFVFVPYSTKSNFRALWTGTDFVALVSADWKEAYDRGVLHAQRKDHQLSDACRNGERRGRGFDSSESAEGAFPWFLSYVPVVEHMKLRRDVEGDASDVKVLHAKSPLPPLLERGLRPCGSRELPCRPGSSKRRRRA